MVYRKSGEVDVRRHLRRTDSGFVPVVHHTRGYPPSIPESAYVTNTYGAKANSRRNVINFDDLENDVKVRNPYADYDGDGVVNKFDCHPLDKNRQDEDIRIYQDIHGDWNVEIDGVLQKDAWDTKEAAEIYAYEMRKGHEKDYDLYEAAYAEAEEKLKKDKPDEDEDGDGVKNKDDCHPLDSNRQDEDMRTWLTDGSNVWSGNPEDWEDSDSVWVTGGKDFEKYKKESERKWKKYIEKQDEGSTEEFTKKYPKIVEKESNWNKAMAGKQTLKEMERKEIEDAIKDHDERILKKKQVPLTDLQDHAFTGVKTNCQNCGDKTNKLYSVNGKLICGDCANEWENEKERHMIDMENNQLNKMGGI